MVVCSCQQFRLVRSSAVPPDFFLSDGACPHVCLWGWCGRASSSPPERVCWDGPIPAWGCWLFQLCLQNWSQLLLLLLLSRALDFQVSGTLGDFTQKVFLNCGFLFDLLF